MRDILQGNKAAIFWAIIRVMIGWQWLVSGWHKIGNFNASGFISDSIKSGGQTNYLILQWYEAFLENFVLNNIEVFNILIPWGELLVGLGLILGMFSTAALLAGAFMNLNFMLAGATDINPILYTIEIILLFMRPVTYRYGFDYYITPKLKEMFSKK